MDCKVAKVKGRDLTQSTDKSHYTNRKSKKAKRKHKNAIKTSITQELRTDFSWSNESHPIGVVKPDYGIPTYLLTTKAVK